MKQIFEKIQSITEFTILDLGNIHITIGAIISIALYVFLTIFIVKVARRFILNRLSRKMEDGRRKAVFNLVRYVIWVIASVIMLDAIGIELNYLLTGAAALLIGVGIGIQQIFNDIVSGVIIQIEGTVAVGDVVEMDGLVGIVKEIHVRTSIIQTRDDIVMIVPNSKFVGERVINWSHIQRNTRFNVIVSVAYGSDIVKVEKILLQCMHEQTGANDHPNPRVWLKEFGDSGLLFYCYFWSTEAFGIEAVKSELRFKIYKRFRENGIVIPFPQRDVHVHQPAPPSGNVE